MTSSPMAAPAASPVHVSLDSPLEINRWSPIVNVIMAIPHLIFLYILTLVLEIVTVIAWFAILFTGEYPPAMFDFATGVLRYQWRVYSYFWFMREEYPSFTLTSGPQDPGDDPAKWSIDRPPQTRAKMTVLFRLLLVIPALIVLYIYGIGALICLVIGWFTVLFTGAWPEGPKSFVMKVVRYAYRVNAYYLLMTDLYPGFSVE